MKRTWIIIGGLMVSVLAIVGLTVIPALAQSGDSEAPEKAARCEAFLGKVADNLSIDVDTLSSAIVDAKLQGVNEAVAAGKLTEEQADKLRERIQENGACPMLQNRMHRGHGPIGKFGQLGQGMLDRAVEEGIITQEQADEVAAIFAQIKEYCLENGRPGIGPRDGQMLDRAVEEGIITQDQADTITEVMESVKVYMQENGLQRGAEGNAFRGGKGLRGMGNGGFSGQTSGSTGQMQMNGFGA